jgi:hypothetical protein
MRIFSKTMAKAALMAIALLAPNLATAQTYAGPKCLGPFCVDRKVFANTLIERLGPSISNRGIYGSKDNLAFLQIVGASKDEIGAVELGDTSPLKSSEKELLATSKEDFRSWKTHEGIGLGSPEEDVLKAYGKPSGQYSLRPSQDAGGSSIETKTISYKGRISSSVKTAHFDIRSGKVASIGLSILDYPGPDCVGPLCGLRWSNAVFQELDGPMHAQSSAGLVCYQSRKAENSLYLSTGDSEPPEIDTVFLSDFSNCFHWQIRTTQIDLGSWRTPEGIGLGSTEEELLHAYGKPSSEETINAKNCCQSMLRGFRRDDPLPNVGEKSLSYEGKELMRATFGIRNGKVSFIWISDAE